VNIVVGLVNLSRVAIGASLVNLNHTKSFAPVADEAGTTP